MIIETYQLQLHTEGNTEMYDISAEVQDLITSNGYTEGQACIFGFGSTTGVTTVEYEPGLVRHDVREMLSQIAPYGKNYAHNQTWGDDNGASHLRSFLVGTSLNVPFTQSQLVLGTWQQIVFLDFDTRPRDRKIVVQILGEKSR